MAKKKKGPSGTRIQVIDRASGRVDKKATEEVKANNALFEAMYENQQFAMGRGANRLVSSLAGRQIPGLGTIPMNAPVMRRHASRANRIAGRPTPFHTRKRPNIRFGG
jgi:hypothetical protein